MKKLYLNIILAFMLHSCKFYDDFWSLKKIDLKEGQFVDAIQLIDKQNVYLGGSQMIGTYDSKLEDENPFILQYNYLQDTIVGERNDFDCNTITNFNKYSGFIVASGLNYKVKPYYENVYYLNKGKSWKKIQVPYKNTDLLTIKDSLTYYFIKDSDQFGFTILKTKDGGLSWNEHDILMKPNEKDDFIDYCVWNDKLFGVRWPFSDLKKKSLLYLDLKTFKFGQDVLLPENEEVRKIKPFKNKIYLLTKNKDYSFIKVLDASKNELKIVEKLLLDENDYPSELYLYKDFQIVIISNSVLLGSSYKLMYKKQNERKWQVVDFPFMYEKVITFENGVLMAVTGMYTNEIVFVDFNKFE